MMKLLVCILPINLVFFIRAKNLGIENVNFFESPCIKNVFDFEYEFVIFYSNKKFSISITIRNLKRDLFFNEDR